MHVDSTGRLQPLALETRAPDQRVAQPQQPTAQAGFSNALSHIPSLDGLRAVSVTLVFLAHSGLDRIVPGGLGVTIFFFLSGYLITTLMRAEFARYGAVNLSHFWLRRCLRILPPFYIVLCLAVVMHVSFSGSSTLSLPGTLAQVFHVTNYWAIQQGFDGLAVGSGVYWSLAVEEHFYLLFPWLFIALQRRRLAGRDQALIIWALCALILVWRCVLVLGYGVPDDRTYLATDARVDSILFGCALAMYCNPVLDATALRPSRWQWVYLPMAVLLLLSTLLVRSPEWRETLRYSMQGIALTVIFIAAIRFPQWWVFRPLNWRPITFLGVLSYSLYLVHQVVLLAISKLAPDAGWAWTALPSLAISLVLAYGLYRWVETPCAHLRRRLTT